MIGKEPIAEHLPSSVDNSMLTPWSEARRRLEEADSYWLATVRPDGRPHVMPVLAVWLEGALYFATSATSGKGKKLTHNSHCVLTVSSLSLRT